MSIRKEEAKDYEIIYSVIKKAFDSTKHADGNEQDLVNASKMVMRIFLSYHWLQKLMASLWDISCLQKRKLRTQ